jgi:hypothetical protein
LLLQAGLLPLAHNREEQRRECENRRPLGLDSAAPRLMW